MGRIGDPVFRLPAVAIWLGLLLAASPDRVVGQPNVIGCLQTLASVLVPGGISHWTLTSPGGAVRINTCSTGTDTMLYIVGDRLGDGAGTW